MCRSDASQVGGRGRPVAFGLLDVCTQQGNPWIVGFALKCFGQYSVRLRASLGGDQFTGLLDGRIRDASIEDRLRLKPAATGHRFQEARQANLRTGYVPDEPYLYDKLTGREFLHFIADLYGLPRAVAGSASHRDTFRRAARHSGSRPCPRQAP